MEFLSPGFAILTGILLVIYYLLKKRQWVVLLAGSLCFFFLLSGGLPVLLIVMALIAYGYGLNAKRLEKRGEVIAVIALFAVLLLFRHVLFSICYSGNAFFSETPVFPEDSHSPVAGIADKIFPLLGISFYTMTAAAYCMDVRREKVSPEQNFAKLLLILCFYPSLLQGPIHRYGTFSGELLKDHPLESTHLIGGCQRILFGLIKKLVLVPRLRMLPDLVFGTPEEANGMTLILGSCLFLAELYTDWTGYMDLVLGVSELFGIKMEENFSRPFFATSLSDFWKRWHMTLTAWFQEYVYFPFGGSRVAAGRIVLNVAAVWLFTGLWHGASAGYLLWALYFWLFSCIGILMKKKGSHHKVPRFFKMAGVWILVTVGFFFFAAADFQTVSTLISRFGALPVSEAFSDTKETLKILYGKWDVVVLAGGMTAFFLLSLVQEKGMEVREKIAGWRLPLRWVFWLAAVFFVILFGVYGKQYDASAFLYQEF